MSFNTHSSQCTHVVPSPILHLRAFLPQIDLDCRWNTRATSILKLMARFEEVKFVLLQARKAFWGSTCIVPLITHLSTRRRWVNVHLHAPPAVPQERTHWIRGYSDRCRRLRKLHSVDGRCKKYEHGSLLFFCGDTQRCDLPAVLMTETH